MYSFTSRCLTRDGAPWFPVMGEFHYSRFRETLWEESLRKIKAGGLSIVSTYVIWIHHEEQEGVFDFTGCRSLRRFLEACRRTGLLVFLRLGPWVHGEVRNGGFPDWLQKKEGEIRLRTNDPAYLALVRRCWERVRKETEGLMYGEGGPVIGVQIENEYGHVGGLSGEEGELHMRTLAALARELGFDAPLFTATGWGGACTGGLLPVMGGYCEAPWDQSTGELPANPNYVFSTIRNDSLIACDHHVEDAVTFDESCFPFLTAELGGGLQVTKHRRPVATGKDIGAMSIAKLGSGAALLGYYMYHGGSNPEGKLSTLQESKATGYANDLPEINYDFNAPIRQYGTISDTYREIRLLALFLRDFGEDLAALPADISPDGVSPEDLHTLRLSSRHDGAHGYVFFNNYQRRRTMDAHRGVVLTGPCSSGDVTFPPVDIESGQYGFFPYRLRLGDAVLRTALAVPLCRLRTKGGEIWVFYGNWEPCFAWEKGKAEVLHLTRAQALCAAKVTLDQDYLVLSDGFVWEENGRLVVRDSRVIRTFPRLEQTPEGFSAQREEDGFFVYERPAAPSFSVRLAPAGVQGEDRVYDLFLTYPPSFASRSSGDTALLKLRFEGESMEIFLEGRKINDYFYTGQAALLSLDYFDLPTHLRAVVHPLHADDAIFFERRPSLSAELRVEETAGKC